MKSHLCGLTTIESARSTPSRHQRSSGRPRPTRRTPHRRGARRQPPRNARRAAPPDRPRPRRWCPPSQPRRLRRRAESRPACGSRRRQAPCAARGRGSGCFLDREVRVFGGVHRAPGPKSPRGRERRRASRSTPCPRCARAGRSAARELREPVERDLLELGRRRRGAPRHRVDVQGGDQQLGEDPRLRAGVGEVREEARVVPVRERRHDQLVEVSQDVGERLRSIGGRGGESRLYVAGPYSWHHRPLIDSLEVRRDPVRRRSQVVAKGRQRPLRRCERFRIRSTCFHVRAFTTSSLVSQARRAWPTPNST